MYKVEWHCDICGGLVDMYISQDNIPDTRKKDVAYYTWEIPLEISDCIRRVIVCNECRRIFLPADLSPDLTLDLKSPRATSRPSD